MDVVSAAIRQAMQLMICKHVHETCEIHTVNTQFAALGAMQSAICLSAQSPCVMTITPPEDDTPNRQVDASRQRGRGTEHGDGTAAVPVLH